MVFKTLHWYICRELLRNFFLTVSALTPLLAFGGTFKDVTKVGIEASQLMAIMMNLMPAMLAYTIPISALFAAVLVYWRLSTDNELTACRASGISFVSIVMPALFLGVVMATTDLVFVNYVVPIFLQRTENVVRSDFAGLLVNQIGKQEVFNFKDIVIYADSAREEPSKENDPNTTVVVLTGMAGTKLKDKRPTEIGVAREARLTIRMPPTPEGEMRIFAQCVDGAAFDPTTFNKVSGSLDTDFFGAEGFPIESQIRNKPKFANLSTLFAFHDDPTNFPPVKKVIESIVLAQRNSQVSQKYIEEWQLAGRGQKPVVFNVRGYSASTADEYRVYAPDASVGSEQQVVFKGTPQNLVRVDQYTHGKLQATYTCGEADLMLFSSSMPLIRTELSATLELSGAPNDPSLDTTTIKKIEGRRLTTGQRTSSDDRSDGITCTIDDTTEITIDGKKARLQELRDGMQIQLALNKDESVATRIRITNVRRKDHTISRSDFTTVGQTTLPGIIVPPSYAPGTTSIATATPAVKKQLIGDAIRSGGNLKKLGEEASKRITKLMQTIDSELHSRASFSVACLTLVLLGAALGILMRGRNPLGVFVVGFVPAILLVLLIVAGRQVAEGSAKNVVTGIVLIWAGNAIIFAMVGVVYSKLLRH